MMLKQIYKIALSLLLIGIGLETHLFSMNQVDDSTGWGSYEYIQKSTPWLYSENAAALHTIAINQISYAETYLKKDNGKFKNYFESDNSLEYGARAKSIYRLNSKTVFQGGITYSHFEGENMSGSTFINPYESPFNIVEYNTDTQGKKALETYHLMGAFSSQLAEKFNVGAKLDYTTANYAKYKDLRHENKEMDLILTLGATYNITPHLDVGINYLYRRRLEDIRYQSYGNKDREYTTLIDFGSFYGFVDRFNKDAVFIKADVRNPLFDKYQGFSFQLNSNLSSRITFFNELTMKWRYGYYGNPGTASIVYTEHDSHITRYKGILSLQSNQEHHILSFNLSRELLENYRNSYQKNTLSDGYTVIDYFSKEQMLNKTIWKLGGNYTAYLGVQNNLPSWILSVDMEVNDMKQTVSLYPNYRKQDINNWKIGALAGRNIIKRCNQYSVSVGIDYFSGGGNSQKDGIYDTSNEWQNNFLSLDDYLYEEFEYLTSNRIKGNVEFRYSRLFDKQFKGYVQLNYALTNAFSTQYVGNTFNQLALTIGVGF